MTIAGAAGIWALCILMGLLMGAPEFIDWLDAQRAKAWSEFWIGFRDGWNDAQKALTIDEWSMTPGQAGEEV